MTKTVIYIVRHGESEANRDDTVSGGGTNPSLTTQGELQAHATKETLGDVSFHQVYSSDLKRAVHTAEIIAGRSVHPDNQRQKLREKSYGALEGKSNQILKPDRDMRRKLPKQQSWDYKHVDDMESDNELADRLLVEITDIAVSHPGETILIGNHGTAIRVILMRLQDKHFKEFYSRSMRNGGFIKLVYNDHEFTIDEVYGYN